MLSLLTTASTRSLTHVAPHRAFSRCCLPRTFTRYKSATSPTAGTSSARFQYFLTRRTQPRTRRNPVRRNPHPAKMGFGDFQTICEKASIPLCALVGHQAINNGVGIQTKCYARTIEIANTLIFEAANDFMHILAMIMTVVMIIHVRSKFTAVGMLAHQVHKGHSTLINTLQAERKSRPSSTFTSS
jgi:hypothetical protein